MDHTGQYYEAHDLRKYLIPNTCEMANNWNTHDNNMKNMTFEKLIPNTCRRANYETMQGQYYEPYHFRKYLIPNT